MVIGFLLSRKANGRHMSHDIASILPRTVRSHACDKQRNNLL